MSEIISCEYIYLRIYVISYMYRYMYIYIYLENNISIIPEKISKAHSDTCCGMLL
jgi:hypothetical protein